MRQPLLVDMSVMLPAIWTAALVFASELTLLSTGLSTVTYTPSGSEKVREALRVPETLSVETIMPPGYSADDKPREPRRALSELIYRNTVSYSRGSAGNILSTSRIL